MELPTFCFIYRMDTVRLFVNADRDVHYVVT